MGAVGSMNHASLFGHKCMESIFFGLALCFCHLAFPMTFSIHLCWLFKRRIDVVGELITFHHVKNICDGTFDYFKLVMLQIRLPMLGNDIIEDIPKISLV
jgi:hypothetical protein